MTPDLSGPGRAHVARRANAPASVVWAVLADGWLYANWVVGASRVRAVELSWPAVGSRIEHSIGVWPAVINDETVVLESVPERRLVLQAKGWPAGEAMVELRIDQAGDNACDLTLVEDVVKGPGVLVPRAVRQPLIAVRNREVLRRLTLIAEGRHREAQAGPEELSGP